MEFYVGDALSSTVSHILEHDQCSFIDSALITINRGFLRQRKCLADSQLFQFDEYGMYMEDDSHGKHEVDLDG
ncbi:hypothetical protein YC2023_037061 [Brassica napus]